MVLVECIIEIYDGDRFYLALSTVNSLLVGFQVGVKQAHFLTQTGLKLSESSPMSPIV